MLSLQLNNMHMASGRIIATLYQLGETANYYLSLTVRS